MTKPLGTEPSNNRPTSDSFETKPANGPHELITQNYTSKELSRLMHLCIDEHREGAAAEKIRVETGTNRDCAKHRVAISEIDASRRNGDASPSKSLKSRVSADVITVAASTQLDCRRRIKADTVVSKSNSNRLDRGGERSEAQSSNRFFSSTRTGQIGSKYRLGVLVFLCSAVTLAHFRVLPFRHITQKRPPSAAAIESSKSVKRQTPKPQTKEIAKQNIGSESARTEILLQKNANNSTPLDIRQTSISTKSSTPNERDAVDLLIAGRLQAAYRRYCEIALHKHDRPVFWVIARALARRIAGNGFRHTLSGNDICLMTEAD